MRALAGALALAVVLATAAAGGCGGGGEEAERTLRLAATPLGGAHGDASPGPGKVALAFVRAARAGDAEAMWSLLSTSTRESWGPTPDAFARGTAQAYAEGFEDFRGERVLLSRRLPGGWGVGAVVGRYEPEDGDPEPAAFAAALRREGESWRVELGAVNIARLDPAPLAETEERPEIGAEAQAGGEVSRLLLWVDEAPVSTLPRRRGPFAAEVRGRIERALRPGPHAVVAFAASADGAGALAWTFEVEG